MLEIEPLTAADKQAIAGWPAYAPPYEKLDYGVRSGKGWLDTHPNALAFGFWREHRLVAFTLLVPTSPGIAEFYVAVHPAALNQHVGSEAARATVVIGFERHAFRSIFLRVRVNHPVGMHVYQKLGFTITGDMNVEADGVPTEFHRMELTKAQWIASSGSKAT